VNLVGGFAYQQHLDGRLSCRSLGATFVSQQNEIPENGVFGNLVWPDIWRNEVADNPTSRDVGGTVTAPRYTGSPSAARRLLQNRIA
jgi:hypothetical protein